MFQIGIEQEVVFIDRDGTYLDADHADYERFAAVVDALPAEPQDAEFLETKSLEQSPKRCYVEGFERHDAQGNRLETLPKALEIRTLPHDSVAGVVAEFRETFRRVAEQAASRGMEPVLVSRHPFSDRIEAVEQAGAEEAEWRTPEEMAIARRSMVSHGMHVNVSLPGFSDALLEARLARINHYTPALIPWSFSSPFHQGGLFQGLCARNWFRAESRRMADLQQRPSGQVIEFRGFDALGDPVLLENLLTVYLGFLLNENLAGQAGAQSPDRIREACREGFSSDSIRVEGLEILKAAEAGLPGSEAAVQDLRRRLESGDCPSQRLLAAYRSSGSIIESLRGHYEF